MQENMLACRADATGRWGAGRRSMPCRQDGRAAAVIRGNEFIITGDKETGRRKRKSRGVHISWRGRKSGREEREGFSLK